MKKFTLLISLLTGLLSTQLNAQDTEHEYIPMAVEGAQSLYHSGDDDYYPPWLDYYFGYHITGDTIIDGITYKKVYYKDFFPIYDDPDNNPPTTPLYSSAETLVGAIRDDIPNKKVYGIIFCDAYNDNACPCYEDILLYDFSLNLGEEFEGMCLLDYVGGRFVDDLYNMDLFDATRDVFQINGVGFGNAFLIEGVGSSVGGIFRNICVDEVIGINIEDFCIGENESCLDGVWALGMEDNLINEDITIFPNPAKSYISINNSSDISVNRIKIYNILGELLLVENQNFHQLNIEKLPAGMLLIEIHINKGIVVQKLIKQ